MPRLVKRILKCQLLFGPGKLPTRFKMKRQASILLVSKNVEKEYKHKEPKLPISVNIFLQKKKKRKFLIYGDTLFNEKKGNFAIIIREKSEFALLKVIKSWILDIFFFKISCQGKKQVIFF